MHPLLQAYLDELPLIAILRGITYAEAADVTEVLYQAGFRIIEVPLNSPEPLRSVEHIAKAFGDRMLLGAGTVLSTNGVEAVCAAGGSSSSSGRHTTRICSPGSGKLSKHRILPKIGCRGADGVFFGKTHRQNPAAHQGVL